MNSMRHCKCGQASVTVIGFKINCQSREETDFIDKLKLEVNKNRETINAVSFTCSLLNWNSWLSESNLTLVVSPSALSCSARLSLAVWACCSSVLPWLTFSLSSTTVLAVSPWELSSLSYLLKSNRAVKCNLSLTENE